MDAAGTRRLTLDDVLAPNRERSLRRFPKLVRRAFALVHQAAPRELATSSVLQLGAGVGVALQLLAGRHLISLATASDGATSLRTATVPAVALILITAAVTTADLFRTEQQRLVAELTTRHALDRLIDVAEAVELIEFERPSFHDRLQRAQINAGSRPLQIVSGAFGMLSAFIASIGIMVALLVISPFILVLVLAAYLPVWLVSRMLSRSMYEFTSRLTGRDRQRLYLFTLLTGKPHATELRSFGTGAYLRRRYDVLYAERMVEMRRHARGRVKIGMIGTSAASLMTGVMLLTLFWMVSDGRLTVAQAGTAGLAITMLGSRLSTLASSAGALYEGSLFLEDYTQFVDAVPRLLAERPTAAPPTTHQRVVLDRVSFTYPSSARPSLRNVSLELHAGKIVAIVGENGSGKTTLAKVVAGLLQPSSGAVYWDGTDLATVDPQQVRERISILFQDYGCYHLSVRDNIVLGRPAAASDEPRVQRAVQAAGADGLLSGLPGGLDAPLGPEFLGGSDLSGGQWQRLAMARAFFREADIVVLDEPTASLDPQAEADVFERVRKLWAGRTVLLISHRFSSVRYAHRIYVLHEGRVLEEGGHDELMRYGGHYARMFTTQATAYRDVAESIRSDPAPSPSFEPPLHGPGSAVQPHETRK
ncbi:MAG: ABC transporter ATP-binding protein [Acidimicrobiia bacterium]